MKIAVLGGGLQGCCVAKGLADKGHSVDLYEMDQRLMGAASRWNEGKLHLGYVYAKDPSLKTAERVAEGSLSFDYLFQRLFGESVTRWPLSKPFAYDVLHGSQLSPEQVGEHFQAVDQICHRILADNPHYSNPLAFKEAGPMQRAKSFGDGPASLVSATALTQEVALDVHAIADFVESKIQAEPRVSVKTGTTVDQVEQLAEDDYRIIDADGEQSERYAHVVNATWQNRLKIDSTLGLQETRRWFHRYKFAVHFAHPSSRASTHSHTGVLGEYGDWVVFADDRVYLSWYPSCRVMTSTDLAPAAVAEPKGEARQALIRDALAGACTVWPALRDIDLATTDIQVAGGYIYSLGASDISDPASLLHERHAVGIVSRGNYHSVDTGKYCLAPINAQRLVDAIEAG